MVLAEQGASAGPDTVDGRRLLDAALETAQQNQEEAEASGLFYMRSDSRRCLAMVTGSDELHGAEQMCAAADDWFAKRIAREPIMARPGIYRDSDRDCRSLYKQEGRAQEADAKLVRPANSAAIFSDWLGSASRRGLRKTQSDLLKSWANQPAKRAAA